MFCIHICLTYDDTMLKDYYYDDDDTIVLNMRGGAYVDAAMSCCKRVARDWCVDGMSLYKH